MNSTRSVEFEVRHGLRGWRGAAWRVLAPVRAYLRDFPFPRGKGLLLRGLVLPVLPKNGTFDVHLPGGGVLPFQYRERLGLGFLLRGEFERAELHAALEATGAGGVAFDVGANVGLYSLSLASIAGPTGRVIAVEPLAENVARIDSSARRSGFTNVTTICCAAGAEMGSVDLHLAQDSAFTSVDQPKEGGDGRGTRTVAQRTLDSIWYENGCPPVTFVKIDVEGMEASVLCGATDLIRTGRPVLLLEANSAQQLTVLTGLLEPSGYRPDQPEGFEPWNFLFRPER